jgi:hypothetical protein
LTLHTNFRTGSFSVEGVMASCYQGGWGLEASLLGICGGEPATSEVAHGV